MAKYVLVITDPQKAHAARRAAYAKAFRDRGYTTAKANELAAEYEPNPPVEGALWTSVTDSDCPFGRPNCRNCGDPAFANECAMAGHCSQCGTMHGIAPDSVLVAKGITLRESKTPDDTEMWDHLIQDWVPRPSSV